MLRKVDKMVALGNIKGRATATRFDHKGNLKTNKQQSSGSTSVVGQEDLSEYEDEWTEQ